MATPTPEPIAIVGMACRFPGGADNPEKLWDLVCEGRQCWQDVPPNRYNWSAFHHPDPAAQGTHNARGGFFLDQDPAVFDASFFGIPAAEAAAVDPQQRLLLEVSYEAFENAGMPVECLRGSQTGVYVALVSRDYDRQIYKDPSQIPQYHLTGCGDATACGRISYTFDLKGPCLSLDTGCSGGMIAINLACQSLRLGESKMALVAGSNLLLGPDMTIAMSSLHMVNDNGRCYPFDSRGSGYGRAEGVAVLVLKRWQDAVRDGDSIRAIIRNSGGNQDGKTNGILLPNPDSQEQLAKTLYSQAGLKPQDVCYVEAHGTGTQAGDAAEVDSLKAVFGGDTRKAPLFLGSIKANIGHTESTSGLAGVIKAVLALEKGVIPPVAELDDLKPYVRESLEGSDIMIPRKPHSWPHEGPRLASVNSFGFGGSNAHVILESATAKKQNSPGVQFLDTDFPVPDSNGAPNYAHSGSGSDLSSEPPENASSESSNTSCSTPVESGDEPESSLVGQARLFVVSAKSKAALEAMTLKLKRWAATHCSTPADMHKLAYTLAARRSKFSWRYSFVASNPNDLIAALQNPRATRSSLNTSTVFLFTGQGAQYHGMGRELLRRSAIFAASLEQSQRILIELGATWSLVDELLCDESKSRINTSEISQPATTAIQIALVDLLTDRNVHPSAVLGHSSGEVAAAYAAGSLSQSEAMTIAYHKGFVAAWSKETRKTKGAMLAVGLGQDDIAPYMEDIHSGRLSVACLNSPTNVTISGDEAAVIELKGLLDKDSIFNRQLKVDVAYHSHHMQSVSGKFYETISNIAGKKPRSSVSFFSSVTTAALDSQLGASYWVDNLVSAVRFSEALEKLVNSHRVSDSPHLAFIEIGPHASLKGSVRQIMSGMSNQYLKWTHTATLVRGKDANEATLDMMGSLFEQGASVDIITEVSNGYKIPADANFVTTLPPYAWDHSNKYWHESRLSKEYRFRQHPPDVLLGLRLPGSSILEPVFRNIISVDKLPWLQGHIIDGFALYPGSAFLCMAIEALRQVLHDRGESRAIKTYVFNDISFFKALVIPDSPAAIEVVTSLKPSASCKERLDLTWEEFRVTSVTADGTWSEHCRGFIRAELRPASNQQSDTDYVEQVRSASVAVEQLKPMRENCLERVEKADIYDRLRRNGIDYSEDFAIIQSLELGDSQAIGRLVIPDIGGPAPPNNLESHVIHPAVFDAFMHIVLPLYHRHCREGAVMLTSLGEVCISADILQSPGDELVVACRLTHAGRRQGSVEVSVFQAGPEHKLVEVATLSREEFTSIGEVSKQSSSDVEKLSFPAYHVDWVPIGNVSTESYSENSFTQRKISISHVSNTAFASTWAEVLTNHFSQQSEFVLAPYNKEFPDANSIHIMVQEGCDSSLQSDSFPFSPEAILSLCSQLRSIIWVTINPGQGKQSTNVSVTDILRVAREEFEQLRAVSLIFDDLHVPTPQTVYDCVAMIIHKSFSCEDSTHPIDIEYIYRNSSLLAPRLTSNTLCNQWQAARKSPDQFIESVDKFHLPDHALKLHVKVPGLLDSIVFDKEIQAVQGLAADEVLVKVYAHGVNRTDVLIALGRAESNESMFGEFAGKVVACGAQNMDDYNPGDRVCGWGSIMPYGNFAKVQNHMLHRMSESISYFEGASIPVAFQTAYYAFIDIARLEPSDSVLIHGAAGAVGQAAISIARHIGAVVYATVGSSEKRRLLTEQLGFSDSQVFSSRSTAFQRDIHNLTERRGVQVVLNCCTNDLLRESVACVADAGFLIDVTKSKTSLSFTRGPRSFTFVSVDMRVLSQKRPREFRRRFGEVMALYHSQNLKPLQPLTSMSISEVSNAFRLVQSQRHSGKVILEADDGVLVKQVSRPPDALGFDPDGTYLVVGGSIVTNDKLCAFFTSRQAKNLISIVAPDNRENNPDIRQEVEWRDINFQRIDDISNDGENLEILQKYRQMMPPIKGVVYAEMLTKPKYPKQVTRKDMQEAVQIYNTASSILHIVKHEPLDFYITLSSIDGTLSRQGRAASAAVISTLGRLSDTLLNPETLNAVLHLGPVNGIADLDSSFRNIEETQSLMKMEELESFLEFCTSPMSRKNGYLELFVGVESAISPPFKDAIFKLLSNGAGNKDAESSEPGSQKIENRIANADNLNDVHLIVTTAVVDELSVFLALDAEEISENVPVTSLGLDSLLAIEFKNWIVRTMQAPMQTSEILDASSLKSLVNLIVQRSKLVHRQTNGVPDNANNGSSKTEPQAVKKAHSAPPEAGGNVILPRLPLPELKTLIERHLSYVRPFASDEEYKNTLRIAEEFQIPGSPGNRLYERMQSLKRADPENWYRDLYMKNQYFARNVSLAPFMSFFFTHLLSQKKHAQSERAALVASKLISYKSALENGLIRPRYVNELPLCMDLHQHLFNACREPRVGPDTLNKYPGHNYFVVLRRGHLFRIDFDPHMDSVGHERLEAVFDAILEIRLDEVDWLGILTADNRASWAKIRRAFIELSIENAGYVKTIEEAAFVVCLDDAAPESPNERARHFHFSDGSNRWFDKPMHFIITSNAVSGVFADHTGLDAGTVHELNVLIAESISSHQPRKTRQPPQQELAPELIKHTALGSEIEAQILKVRNNYNRAIAIREHCIAPPLLYGSSLMKKYKLAPNSAFQMIIQLAFRYYFGHTEPCWETVLQSHFHKGRVELNQVVTTQVAAFLEAASDESTPLSTCRRLLIDAIRVHSSSILACTRAGGSDRFLSLLKELVEEGEEQAELHRDPVYQRSRPRKTISNTFQTGMAENGCCLRDEEGIWLHYEVEPERVKFCMLGPAGQMERFCDGLKKAATRVMNILEEKQT